MWWRVEGTFKLSWQVGGKTFSNADEAMAYLDELGRDGWELVSVFSKGPGYSQELWFKRRALS